MSFKMSWLCKKSILSDEITQTLKSAEANWLDPVFQVIVERSLPSSVSSSKSGVQPPPAREGPSLVSHIEVMLVRSLAAWRT